MVYADYNATTPLLPAARQCWQEVQECFWGNPSSLYLRGRQARTLVEQAREELAALVGARPEMILFTSGGSEANNWVLRGFDNRVGGNRRKKLLISSVEHPSILLTAQEMQRQNMPVEILPVSSNGQIDEEIFLQLVGNDVGLASLMYANNETGTLFNIPKYAAYVKQSGGLMHSDASQAIGKIPVHFLNDGLDFMTISAHKFYGPKGVGALVVRDRRLLDKQGYGGGQEFGMRPGTENVANICAMVAALKQLFSAEYAARRDGIQQLRDWFENEIVRRVDNVCINGDRQHRLPNTSNIAFNGLQAHGLLMNLDLRGMAASAGSACHSGSLEPPHVLLAMGQSEEMAKSALRFSFGIFSTPEEVAELAQAVCEFVPHLRDVAAKKGL